MRLVPEGNAVELSVALRGDDGSLWTPTTLKYRIDDDTGRSVTAWTSLTPESITPIAIPASANVMLDDSRSREDRIVTVMADEGLVTQLVATQQYRLENLAAV